MSTISRRTHVGSPKGHQGSDVHRSFVAHVRKIAKWEPVQPRPDTDSVKLCSLFDQIVAMDLEGIVCKRRIRSTTSRKSLRDTGSKYS